MDVVKNITYLYPMYKEPITKEEIDKENRIQDFFVFNRLEYNEFKDIRVIRHVDNCINQIMNTPTHDHELDTEENALDTLIETAQAYRKFLQTS